MRLILDCETNAIKNPTKLHCIVAKDIDADELYTFVGQECKREFPSFIRRATLIVGHNIINYDCPVLSNLTGCVFQRSCVRDSLILSRLLEFSLEGGHSLDSWGKRLGIEKKGTSITNWEEFTLEMLERCISDVEINHELYDHLLTKARIDYKDTFKKAVVCEHEIAWICQDMHTDGFGFNIEKANELYEEIKARVEAIDGEIQTAFPPKVETIQLKTKVKEIVTPFNPGSPKQVVERLSGHWRPVEFTDKGQAKVSEANLATLSDEAPEAAKRLVERLLLSSRLRTLDQWFEAYNASTRRIHAGFTGLGTWTGRMSHKEPNLGNVAAPKSIKYRGKLLAQLATSYGGRMRELWRVEGEDTWLVGTDAEGIQLRIFGHYINDHEFIQAAVAGTKEAGTDPHSLNARILQCSRETAKTFIYAFLLGAGDRKIGEILGVSAKAGRAAKQRYIEAIPGLRRLKCEDIPRDAERGFIVGFDGRLVGVESEHKVMAAYLQNGEAVIMKHANILWRRELDEQGIHYSQVNFIHDEWQTMVCGTRELSEDIGRIQSTAITTTGERFALRCPMAGNYRVGKNWLETH